ncbi:hypothetical protein [Thalassospira sp.]|uniref:hypothetical protein n=1 Tax=Thalassospira sp. TaxID=1912094 RepID=UPI0027369D2A|nr:hypothetical protein [Thalassospira sp.]MDP2696806.1 hypothetical protein [Thalassospira sp.]
MYFEQGRTLCDPAFVLAHRKGGANPILVDKHTRLPDYQNIMMNTVKTVRFLLNAGSLLAGLNPRAA